MRREITEIPIKIDSVEGIKRLVYINGRKSFDIDVVAGRTVVDGKSIMGIISVSHSSTICIRINVDDKKAIAEYMEEIKDFIEK